ncbi:hypothetical protein DPEC_G00174510 [Dallia pectoralis]|uniref:Uncharacterized protein n=1 Tax=Dallia pectoralis TaxID=75939 RepID=A0ACC2GE56_DALPE|nr:hypothetical protein DPEC_G00174510 [Dallia pectoralis]
MFIITPATLYIVLPTPWGSRVALVDAVLAVWSIVVFVYEYIQTSAMEERIHALETVVTVHQCVIAALAAGVVVFFTYLLLRKR